MGTTYVTLGRNAAGEPETDQMKMVGFWMRDWVLETWLRFLSLHVEEPEPEEGKGGRATRMIRDQWLLASRGWFNGCVPHGLEEATATEDGLAVVKQAVASLRQALKDCPELIDTSTLNLMGFSSPFPNDLETWRLRDVGSAFSDLLEGRVAGGNHDCILMPGSVRLNAE